MADRYDVSKMKAFWTVSLKTVKNSACFVMEAEELRSAAVLIPNDKANVSVGRYIRSGGLGLIFKMGPRAVSRMLRFESMATKDYTEAIDPEEDGLIFESGVSEEDPSADVGGEG